MSACVQLDDDACPGWFRLDQSLIHGCVLALLLFNIFVAVIHMVLARFEADKYIMDGGAGGSNGRIYRSGDVTLGYATRSRCHTCVTIP